MESDLRDALEKLACEMDECADSSLDLTTDEWADRIRSILAAHPVPASPAPETRTAAAPETRTGDPYGIDPLLATSRQAIDDLAKNAGVRFIGETRTDEGADTNSSNEEG